MPPEIQGRPPVKKTNKTTGPLQLGAAPGKGGLAKLDPAPPPAKKARELTASEKALIEVGSKILATPPEEVDKAYQHAILCQVGFPRSKVDGTSFIRRSGSAWLHVQAGVLDEGEGRGPVMQPIPYGPLPRLALARISTYAVMNSTREIPIGESAAEFLRMMGMDRQGNRYRTLRKQMHALAACRLTVGGHGLTHHLGEPIETFSAWFANEEHVQRLLWPGVLILSEKFYSSLRESAVPLNLDALMALTGSALALDIYVWLAYRLHRVERQCLLHWASLRDQFGQEYRDPKNFKREFEKALRQALAVYPQARVKVVTGGLLLQASPPPVLLRTGHCPRPISANPHQ